MSKQSQSTKAQEEIVGFVLIMLIIAVIFVVFLGIMLHKNLTPEVQESKEAETFLNSMVEVTTLCQIGSVHLNVKDLIFKCNSGAAICDSGIQSCTVLNRTIIEILQSSFSVGLDKPIKSYQFVALDNSTGTSRQIDSTFFFSPLGSNKAILGSQKDIGNNIRVEINLYY